MKKDQIDALKAHSSLIFLIKVSLCTLILLGGCQAFAGKVTFAPYFSIDETYNSNVFYLDQNRAGDFSASLVAAFPLIFSSPSKKFTFRYMPYREVYRKYEQLNYTGHDVSSTYEASGKRYDLQIRESFSYSQRQGYQLDYQGFPVTVLGRTTITTNTFNLAYGLKIRNISSIDVSIDHLLLKYEDLPTYDFEDTTVASSGFDNLFALKSRKNWIGYFYQFRNFQFETIPDQKENAIGLAYKYERLPNTRFVIKAGAFGIDEKSTDQENEIYLHADLLRSFAKGYIRLVISRDAGSPGGLGGLSVDERCFLSFSYGATARASFGSSAEYYRRNPFQEEFVDYATYAVATVFDFKVSRKLSLSLSHRYVDQRPEKGDDLKAKFHAVSFHLEIHPFRD